MSTLYASFSDSSKAEKAAGALLDHGASAEDLSLISNQRDAAGQPVVQTGDTISAERSAKSGISTTTAADVAAGTAKGATVGLGLGVLATLATLFIPGVGIVVVGGGALASALMAGAGTFLASTAVGSITGMLKDQGVPEPVATQYSDVFHEGGSILAVAVPSGDLTPDEAESILAKYGALNVAMVNKPRLLADSAPAVPSQPVVVQPENPAIEPIALAPSQPTYVEETYVETEPVEPGAPLQTIVDPASGETRGIPITAVGVPTPAVSGEVVTSAPNHEVAVDAATGTVHQTVGHATKISEVHAVAVDPETGQARPARIVEEQRAVRREPLEVDEDGNPIPADAAGETVVVRDKRVELR